MVARELHAKLVMVRVVSGGVSAVVLVRVGDARDT